MPIQSLNNVNATTHDALRPLIKSPELYIHDEPISSNNVIKVLGLIVSVGLKKVPYVGALLGALVTALWPKKADPHMTWKDIEDNVKKVASGLIDENNAKTLRHSVEGLYSVLKLYLEQTVHKQRGEYFTSLLTHVTVLEPSFLDDGSPWLSLQYLVPLGTLHLSLLWTQANFYKDIYGVDDPLASQHTQELEDAVTKYKNAITNAKQKCIDWRKDKIQKDKPTTWYGTLRLVSGEETDVRDTFSGVSKHFTWGWGTDYAGLKMADVMVQNLKYEVDASYVAQLDAILEPALLWDLYRPGHNKDSVTRMILEYPGWVGSGSSNILSWYDDRAFFEKYGNITKIVLHAGDRVDGIEVFYGGQSSGLRGAVGGQEHVLNVSSEESITSIDYQGDNNWANHVCRIRFTKKRTVRDQRGGIKSFLDPVTLEGGSGAFSKSYDGTSSDRKHWTRLLWFSGWSRDQSRNGHIYLLWPTFGYREETRDDGSQICT